MKKILLCLIIPVTFVLVMPLLLNIPFVLSALSWFLNSLEQVNYKVAYLGLIGAILGTYFAIMGAVWIQKKEKQEQEESEIKKTATIIYYDIKLGCLELINIADFKNGVISGYIHLVPDWIEKIASLATRTNIQKIYSIYGRFSNLKLKLNQMRGQNILEFHKQEELKTILSQEYFCDVGVRTLQLIESNVCNESILIDKYVQNDIKEVLNKLGDISGISTVSIAGEVSEFQKNTEPELNIEAERIIRNFRDALDSYVIAEKDYAHKKTEDYRGVMLDKFHIVLKAQEHLLDIIWQGTSNDERNEIKKMLSKYINNNK